MKLNLNHKVTSSEAFNSLYKLRNYFLNKGDTEAYESLQTIQIKLMETQFNDLKQSKITQFFSEINNY